MKKIYLIHVCAEDDDNFGEVQVAFDDKKNVISWWDVNDGNFRAEYFGGLMAYLGADVDHPRGKLYDELDVLARAYLKEQGY